VHLRSRIQGPATCLRSTIAVIKQQPKAPHTGRHTRVDNPGTPHTKHIWVQPNHTLPHTSARTLLPVPTNSVHTRRTQSAHPPAGAQTLHQTRLHDDMATYTPDTSTRKGPPSRPQALYPSPRISQNGYKCQPEHHCRCRQTQNTRAHHRRTHRLAHNSAPDTAPRLHTHQTHPPTISGMASRPPIGCSTHYHDPSKTTQTWLHQPANTCCLSWEPRQAQPGPLSCYNRMQNPTGLPPSCKLLRRQHRAPSPQPRQGHP
jgi:hypothetical protein